jgi:hypothetical protein
MAPVSPLSVVPQHTNNNDSLLTGASSGPSQYITYSAGSTAAPTYGAVATSCAPESVHGNVNKILTTDFLEVTPTPTETPFSAAIALIEASPTGLRMNDQEVTVEEATKAVADYHTHGAVLRIDRPQDPATQWFAIISVCVVSGLALGGVVCCVIECMDRRYESELIMPSAMNL